MGETEGRVEEGEERASKGGRKLRGRQDGKANVGEKREGGKKDESKDRKCQLSLGGKMFGMKRSEGRGLG